MYIEGSLSYLTLVLFYILTAGEGVDVYIIDT